MMAIMEPLKLKEICDFFKTQPILKAWVFGSYARGEQTPDSDVDILVDFDPNENFGLFKIVAIIDSLKQILGKEIDLVDRNQVFPAFQKNIEKDKILIYERF